MCSLVLRDVGFEVVDLGPNTPLVVVADAVLYESPSLISVAMANSVCDSSNAVELELLGRIASANNWLLVTVGGCWAERGLNRFSKCATRRLDERA